MSPWVENVQRKDLTPFEEAEALHSLAQRCGYTHGDLAKRLGKSRTAITESLALHGMPPEVRKVCLATKSASRDEIMTALENIIQELRNS